MSFEEESTTGIMLKNKVREGDPDTAYFRRNSAFSTLNTSDIETIDLQQVCVLHVTGIPLALNNDLREAVLKLVKKPKRSGVFITFDPNLRPALWRTEGEMIQVSNECASLANVVLPGGYEGQILTGTSDKETIADFYFNQRIGCRHY